MNWKGGVGKTTLTLNLAAGLAHKDYNVLIVDLDPQCNLSFLALGLTGYIKRAYKEQKPTLKNLFDAYFENEDITAENIIQSKTVRSSPDEVFNRLDVILSHQELVLLDLKLARNQKAGKDHRETTKFEIEKISVIDRLLQQVRDNYNFILLDCPPNVNLVTQNAFFASDFYIVPAIPDFLSTIGISLIDDFMGKFNKDFSSMCEYAEMEYKYKKTKFGGIIFNMVNEYSGQPKQTHNEQIQLIKKQFPDKVFDNYLTGGDGIATASSIYVPIFAHADLPRSNENAKKQAGLLYKIIDELINKLAVVS